MGSASRVASAASLEGWASAATRSLSSAARSRYSASCSPNTSGAQPPGPFLPLPSIDSLPRDFAPGVASIGIESVCTCAAALPSSRSRFVRAVSSCCESSSGLRIRSGTKSPSAATACSTESASASCAPSLRAIDVSWVICCRLLSIARITGMFGSGAAGRTRHRQGVGRGKSCTPQAILAISQYSV